MKSSPISFICQGFCCILQRSSRKTISLSLKPDGSVLIRAPYRCSKEQATLLVRQNFCWLAEKRQSLEAAREDSLLTEEGIQLMDRRFALQLGERAGFQDDVLFLPRSLADPRAAIAAACRVLAEVVFSQRVAKFASQMGLLPAAVTIGRSNSAWGSCGRDGKLRFSWKALFCGPRELDYLVVHELCHLRYFDHSAAFWQLVSETVPDWRACRERMAQTAQRIAAQGWGPY